jgi:hypothetical protein
MASVMYVRARPPRLVSIDLDAQGRATYGVFDEVDPWQARLARLTDAFHIAAQDVDLGFIKYSGAYANWLSLSVARPLIPHIEAYVLRYNRHLYTEYTPDAHGIQVLTDAHLAGAHDLSDWLMEPLGNGRNLVQAPDLEPWYATIDPDPTTLAKARQDFGSITLTEEIVAANPPPWSAG